MYAERSSLIYLVGPANPCPWLLQIAFHSLPRVWKIGDWFGMTAWTYDQIGTRLDKGFEKQSGPDLVHYLLEKSDQPRTETSMRKMRGDSLNAIIAGRFVLFLTYSLYDRSNRIVNHFPSSSWHYFLS